ncbi:PEP-CTERM sorting domain-containing protein [Duganella rivi]|nr:PEP-CTERM sorting domain-containing protein [Duganella rivi]
MKTMNTLLAVLLGTACSTALADPKNTTVDFSGNLHGWVGPQASNGAGGTKFDDLISPTKAMHTKIEDQVITFATKDANFTGNYGTSKTVTISLDVYTKDVSYFGFGQTTRPLIVEMRDYDTPPAGLNYSSVWYYLGDFDPNKPLQHFSVTIADTKSKGLPAGWGGYGAISEDMHPELPSDRTFKNILASVDQLVFSTAMPGVVSDFVNFDVALDNISISAVPEPSETLMLGAGLGLLGLVARRRKRNGQVVN